MIRPILRTAVCGLATYAHARAIADEVNKPKEKRSKAQIAVSSCIVALGTLAIVGNVASLLNKE